MDLEIDVLIIDGVKYRLWQPRLEDDLEKLMKDHTKEIFGEDSIYFDLNQRLSSEAGIRSMPDGFVLTLRRPSSWYIVEVELSSHPIHEHIVSQISRYIPGIETSRAKGALVRAMFDEINRDKVMRAWVETKVGPEIHKFISDTLLQEPFQLVIIIDEKRKELEEAIKSLVIRPKIIEFKTFQREGVGLEVHAHLFQPLYQREPSEDPIERKLCYIEDQKVKDLARRIIKEKLPTIGVEIKIGRRELWFSTRYKNKPLIYIGCRKKFLAIDYPDIKMKEWKRIRVTNENEWDNLFAEKLKPVMKLIDNGGSISQ